MVYVRSGINAKRRKDLEINDISCIWLEISPNKGKPFLIGNMYRPPDSKVEYYDRFEDFIENASEEGKEIILLGDFDKNLSDHNLDRMAKFDIVFRSYAIFISTKLLQVPRL